MGPNNHTPFLHLGFGTDTEENRNWALVDDRIRRLALAAFDLPAGGDLTGFYPDPDIAPGVVGAAELNPPATAGDVGKVLTVVGGPALAWQMPAGGGGGGLAVHIGADAPVAPVAGQLWWRSDPDGQLFVYYNDGTSAQFVPASAATGTVRSGGSQTGVVLVAPNGTQWVLWVTTSGVLTISDYDTFHDAPV